MKTSRHFYFTLKMETQNFREQKLIHFEHQVSYIYWMCYWLIAVQMYNKYDPIKKWIKNNTFFIFYQFILTTTWYPKNFLNTCDNQWVCNWKINAICLNMCLSVKNFHYLNECVFQWFFNDFLEISFKLVHYHTQKPILLFLIMYNWSNNH